MKKLISLFLVIVMVAAFLPTAIPEVDAASYTASSGWGKGSDGKYHIASPEDLVAFANASSSLSGETVVLDNDVVFNDKTAAQMQSGSSGLYVWTAKSVFSGTFDGQGHSVKGLFNNSGSSDVGFIKELYGTVKNVYFTDVYFSGSECVGAVSSRAGGGSRYENVYVDGIVKGTYHVGGIAGSELSGSTTFVSCWFNGDVSASSSYVSGILGNQQSQTATFTDCLNTGSVSCPSNNKAGISNAVYGGYITATRCVNAGDVTGGGYSGSAIAVTIGNAGWSKETTLSHCSFTNCLGVTGLSTNVLPIDLRYNNLYNQTYDGSGIGSVSSIADLSTVSAFSGNWDWAYDGSKYVIAPAYFATGDAPVIEINSYDDLLAWTKNGSDDAGVTVRMNADIVVESDSEGWTPKPTFKGTFDGDGHAIYGMIATGEGNVAFIRFLYGIVKNLYLVDCEFNGTGDCNAAVAAQAYGGSLVKNVYTNAKVTGANHCGGIVANQPSNSGTVTIESCWFDGSVTLTQWYASGILGNQQSNPAIITDCLNTGTVSAYRYIAGISSCVYSGSITATRCVNAGKISDVELSSSVIDKITSSGSVVMQNCYTLSGMSRNAQIRETNGGSVSGSVNVISSLSALTSVSAFSGRWAMRSDGIFAPQVFQHFNEDRIVISNLDTLVKWAKNGSADAGKTVILMADISCSSVTWTPKAEFSGVFEGNGHTISNISASGSGFCGFINNLNGGTVKNLRVKSSTFNGGSGDCCGSIAAQAGNGAVIQDVYSSAAVTGRNHIGGIVGNQSTGTVTVSGCWFDGSVTCSGSYASGILGNQESNKAIFTDCLNTGVISGTSDSWGNMAGISNAVYYGTDTSFVRCVNLGRIYDTKGNIGGAIAKVVRANITMADCFGLSAASEINPTKLEGSPIFKGYNAAGELADYFGRVIGIDSWSELAEKKGITSNITWVLNGDGYYVPSAFADLSAAASIPGETVNGTISIGNLTALKNWASNTSDNFGQTVLLTADITVTSGWTPKASFSGTFDGQGHTISGLSGAKNFITTLNNGSVRNLYIKGSFTGDADVGIIGTVKDYASISNVYTNASFTSTGNNCGGIVASISSMYGFGEGSSSLKISSCWFDGTASAAGSYAAAIVANHNGNHSSITDCLSTGLISAAAHAGGISASVGNGSSVQTRVVNLGKVANGASLSSGIVESLAAASSASSSFAERRNGALSITDGYVLAYNALPYGANVADGLISTLSRAEAVGSADELESISSLTGWTKSNGLMLPGYFAGKSASRSTAPENVVTISSYAGLVDWASGISETNNYAGKVVRLTADIDANPGLTAEQLKAGMGAEWTAGAGKTFKGVLDGQGHTISGLYSTSTGLLENVSGGVIANLSIVDSFFDFGDNSNKGVFVNNVETASCSIFKCRTNAEIRLGDANNIGGFVGNIGLGTANANKNVTFRRCWFDGKIVAPNVGSASSGRYVGTYAGNNQSSCVSIFDSVSAGSLRIANTNGGNGAFAGSVYSGSLIMDNCYSLTDMTGKNLHLFKYNGDDALCSLTNLYADRSSSTATFSDSTPYVEKFPAAFGLFAEEFWDNNFSSLEDMGRGEYTLILDGTSADGYIARLEEAGYQLAYENTLLGDVRVVNFTKDDQLVTVNYLRLQNRTYLSAMCDQPLSPHLRNKFANTALSGKKNVLYQIKINKEGDSYAIQLKNGHFIIIDGGVGAASNSVGELEALLNFLQEKVSSTEKPVIEAWCFTHLHWDHSGLLTQFVSNPDWADRIRVEGFYFNEPSNAVKDYDKAGDIYKQINREYQAISMLKTTSGGTPTVYRPMIGQRYYFCDVTMDIVFSQEMITYDEIEAWNPHDSNGNGAFNDSSTWFNFTMDGKTFLDGGDAYHLPMQFIMNTYDYTDLQVNYFSVLHHGMATWNSFTNWVCSGDASTSTTSQKGFKYLLFPTSGNSNAQGMLNNTANSYLRNRASYGSYSAYNGTDSFTMTPVAYNRPVSLQSVSVSFDGKAEYEIDEELELEGLTAKVTYSNGDTSSFSEHYVYGKDDFGDFTVSGFDSSSGGEKEVTVSFGDKSDKFRVIVVTRFTYGDLNDDTLIDTRDLTLLRQYLADPTTEVNLSAADANGDGPINTLDLTLLRQRLADGTVQLGPASAA